jgi:hypothetical protein
MPKIHKDRGPTHAGEQLALFEVSRETDPLAVFKGAYAAEESTAVREPVDTPRKPGRPKGSKNKPKNVTVANAGAAEGTGGTGLA